MGEHGKVLAILIAAKVDAALEIIHEPLGEIGKVLTGSGTERKKLVFGFTDLFRSGEIDLLHDESGVLSLGKFRDQTEDMVVLFGMGKLVRFGDIGLNLIQVDKVLNRDIITSCGESPYPWESSASSRKRLRSSISVVFPCIFIIPFLFEIHRFVVIVDQAVDQNLLGFCGRYRFVGERVLCDPAAGRDRILDLDESERFELVSISIESRLADTELPDNLTGRGWCAIIE